MQFDGFLGQILARFTAHHRIGRDIIPLGRYQLYIFNKQFILILVTLGMESEVYVAIGCHIYHLCSSGKISVDIDLAQINDRLCHRSHIARRTVKDVHLFAVVTSLIFKRKNIASSRHVYRWRNKPVVGGQLGVVSILSSRIRRVESPCLGIGIHIHNQPLVKRFLRVQRGLIHYFSCISTYALHKRNT